jgi:NADP-dependent 3-hydroxy acid dehydrogenase YdfG
MSTIRQTVLVTGASSGIGRAIALELAAAGYSVIASGRDENALLSLSKLANGIHSIVLDVSSQSSVDTAMQQIEQLTSGRGVDVLINNAGFAVPGPLESVQLDRLQAGFETNVIGLVRMCQAVLPAMRQRRSGCIINISSIVGRISFPFEAGYTSTKHAVEALSDALRFELAPWGIRVLVVQPGAIRTAFQQRGDAELASSLPKESPYYLAMSGFLSQRSKAFKNAPDGTVVARAVRGKLTRPSKRTRIVVPRHARTMLTLFTTGPDSLRDAIKRFAFTPTSKDTNRATQS